MTLRRLGVPRHEVLLFEGEGPAFTLRQEAGEAIETRLATLRGNVELVARFRLIVFGTAPDWRGPTHVVDREERWPAPGDPDLFWPHFYATARDARETAVEALGIPPPEDRDDVVVIVLRLSAVGSSLTRPARRPAPKSKRHKR